MRVSGGGKKRKLMNAANGEVRSVVMFPDFSVIKRAAGSVAAALEVVLRLILRPMSRLGGAIKDMLLFMNWKVSILAPLVLPTSNLLVQVCYIFYAALIARTDLCKLE